MKKILVIMTVTASILAGCGTNPPQLGKAPVKDVISAMTVEEKAHLVIGTGMPGFSGDNAVVGETQSIVPGAAGTTYPIPRLGIPSVVLADGPAGLRISPTRENDPQTYYCTHFPIGTLLSSTWNQPLVEKVGQAIGKEALEYGADVLLAPALNIHRNPLCGRNFEYYSEDPVVSGKIARAYLEGVQKNGVGTSVKHFAANNQESNRLDTDSHVSPRALREIYLKGFEMAIKEGKPWTVMSSYNYLNGVYTSESPELLITLLRDEWGFDGMVMTDWFGGKDAVAQMIAGNDMLQPGIEKQFTDIMEAVKSGKLDEKILDRNIENILKMIVQTPRFKGYPYSNKPDLKAHAAITRQSATEGMVLLKNENGTLPFDSTIKKVALFGCTSYDFIAGGTGSGNVNRAYTVSLPDGLQNTGYQLDEELKKQYQNYISKFKEAESKKEKTQIEAFLPQVLPEEMDIPAGQLQALAQQMDIALITVGRAAGEFADRPASDFYLKEKEQQLIREISREFHAVGKKVVIILNTGGVIETTTWKNQPDAILVAWQAGQEGGNSVADILSGKVSPSGKLPMTFPNKLEDVASSANFPMEGKLSGTSFANREEAKTNIKNWDYTDYEEDIYVGYRYFDTFNKAVSYPFGYGLSYTTFEYASPKIEMTEGHYQVSVTIRNTGNMAGKEVVQLYAAMPEDKNLPKPAKELKDFVKTKELQPGESTTVTLRVTPYELASYDPDQHAWTLAEGTCRFLIASSSRDIKATLEANTPAIKVPTHDILKLQHPIQILTR